MTELIIRDIDADLKARLSEDAAEHGRSVDEHVRILLLRTLNMPGPSVQSESEVGGMDGFEAEFPDIEHIELVVDQRPLKEQSQREHTRVEYGDIKTRFSRGASTRRFRLFTRYFPCELVDISIRGARLRTSRPADAGDPITLCFSSRDGEKTSILARVVRVSSLNGKSFEYSAQFLEAMPKGELRSLICSKVVEQKVRE